MKKLLTLIALLLSLHACASGPNSEIRYKAENKMDLMDEERFNCAIISHEYNATTQEGVITFNGKLTKISSEAFNEASLEWLWLPDSIQDIGDFLFGWGNVKMFKGKYAADNGRCLIINGKLVSMCYPLDVQDYRIPDGVTEISVGAFSFSYINSITIPASVTKIHCKAFTEACSMIILESTKAPQIVGGELHDQTGTDRAVFVAKVYVPKGSAATYKSAPYWKNVKDSIFEY